MNTKEEIKTQVKEKQKAKTANEYEQMLIDFVKDEFKEIV